MRSFLFLIPVFLMVAVSGPTFVDEAFAPGFGFLNVGCVACLILEDLTLVDSPASFIRISPWLIVPIALATAAITFFLVGRIVKAQRAPLQTGSEVMTGTKAEAEEDFTPAEDQYVGMVRTRGELWRAVSQSPVAARQRLVIQSRDGLTLSVRPVRARLGVVTSIERAA